MESKRIGLFGLVQVGKTTLITRLAQQALGDWTFTQGPHYEPFVRRTKPIADEPAIGTDEATFETFHVVDAQHARSEHVVPIVVPEVGGKTIDVLATCSELSELGSDELGSEQRTVNAAAVRLVRFCAEADGLVVLVSLPLVQDAAELPRVGALVTREVQALIHTLNLVARERERRNAKPPRLHVAWVLSKFDPMQLGGLDWIPLPPERRLYRGPNAEAPAPTATDARGDWGASPISDGARGPGHRQGYSAFTVARWLGQGNGSTADAEALAWDFLNAHFPDVARALYRDPFQKRSMRSSLLVCSSEPRGDLQWPALRIAEPIAVLLDGILADRRRLVRRRVLRGVTLVACAVLFLAGLWVWHFLRATTLLAAEQPTDRLKRAATHIDAAANTMWARALRKSGAAGDVWLGRLRLRWLQAIAESDSEWSIEGVLPQVRAAQVHLSASEMATVWTACLSKRLQKALESDAVEQFARVLRDARGHLPATADMVDAIDSPLRRRGDALRTSALDAQAQARLGAQQKILDEIDATWFFRPAPDFAAMLASTLSGARARMLEVKCRLSAREKNQVAALEAGQAALAMAQQAGDPAAIKHARDALTGPARMLTDIWGAVDVMPDQRQLLKITPNLAGVIRDKLNAICASLETELTTADPSLPRTAAAETRWLEIQLLLGGQPAVPADCVQAIADLHAGLLAKRPPIQLDDATCELLSRVCRRLGSGELRPFDPLVRRLREASARVLAGSTQLLTVETDKLDGWIQAIVALARVSPEMASLAATLRLRRAIEVEAPDADVAAAVAPLLAAETLGSGRVRAMLIDMGTRWAGDSRTHRMAARLREAVATREPSLAVFVQEIDRAIGGALRRPPDGVPREESARLQRAVLEDQADNAVALADWLECGIAGTGGGGFPTARVGELVAKRISAGVTPVPLTAPLDRLVGELRQVVENREVDTARRLLLLSAPLAQYRPDIATWGDAAELMSNLLAPNGANRTGALASLVARKDGIAVLAVLDAVLASGNSAPRALDLLIDLVGLAGNADAAALHDAALRRVHDHKLVMDTAKLRAYLGRATTNSIAATVLRDAFFQATSNLSDVEPEGDTAGGSPGAASASYVALRSYVCELLRGRPQAERERGFEPALRRALRRLKSMKPGDRIPPFATEYGEAAKAMRADLAALAIEAIRRRAERPLADDEFAALDNVYMSRHEVSIEDYRALIDTSSVLVVRTGQRRGEQDWTLAADGPNAAYDNVLKLRSVQRPDQVGVYGVTYRQARNAAELLGGRLPTAAEWRAALSGLDWTKVDPRARMRPDRDALTECRDIHPVTGVVGLVFGQREWVDEAGQGMVLGRSWNSPSEPMPDPGQPSEPGSGCDIGFRIVVDRVPKDLDSYIKYLESQR